MDIRLYASFVVTAELMNVTAAAQRLNLTQSALSRQLMTLETHLGIKLFEKAGRNIRLTSEGEALFGKAQSVLAAERDLRQLAGDLAEGETGILKLGTCSQLIERYFPTFLRQWRIRNPGIDFRIEDAGGAELIEKLKGGQVQCTVSAAPAQPLESLEMRRIGSLGFIAVATPEFMDDDGRAIEAVALFDKPLLVLNRKHASREVLDAVMRIYGARPDIVVESASPHTLFSLAQGGNGVAIVPSSARIAPIGLSRRPVTLKGEEIRFDICALWNTHLPLPAYAHRFIDDLADHIAAEEQRDADMMQPVRKRVLYPV